MTSQDTVIEITLRLPYGRFLKFYINSWEPFDFATFQKVNGARIAQKSAPFHSNALRESANGASAPLSLPKRRDNVALPLKEAFAAERSKPKKSIQEELEQAKNALVIFSSKMARLDEVLALAWAEERGIKDAILSTHGMSERGVVVVHLENRRQRRNLFAELDKLAQKWGPRKSERSDLNKQVRALEKQIQHFERIISKERKKA